MSWRSSPLNDMIFRCVVNFVIKWNRSLNVITQEILSAPHITTRLLIGKSNSTLNSLKVQLQLLSMNGRLRTDSEISISTSVGILQLQPKVEDGTTQTSVTILKPQTRGVLVLCHLHSGFLIWVISMLKHTPISLQLIPRWESKMQFAYTLPKFNERLSLNNSPC